MSEQPASSSKRLWLAGAAAAVGLGAGLWWSRQHHGEPDTPAGEPLPADFWGHQFDTPEGPPLKLASFQGKPLLVNFWATWCPPCVKEMPDLDRFHQAHAARGWQVLGLAIDGPSPVKAFLSRTPVSFPIGLAGVGGTELGLALGNQAGGLPFSVVIDARGRLRHRKMGATHTQELNLWASELG